MTETAHSQPSSGAAVLSDLIDAARDVEMLPQ